MPRRCNKKTTNGDRCSRKCIANNKTCWQHGRGIHSGGGVKKVTCNRTDNPKSVMCNIDNEDVKCDLNAGLKSEHDFVCSFLNGSYGCTPQSMYQCQLLKRSKSSEPEPPFNQIPVVYSDKIDSFPPLKDLQDLINGLGGQQYIFVEETPEGLSKYNDDGVFLDIIFMTTSRIDHKVQGDFENSVFSRSIRNTKRKPIILAWKANAYEIPVGNTTYAPVVIGFPFDPTKNKFRTEIVGFNDQLKQLHKVITIL